MSNAIPEILTARFRLRALSMLDIEDIFDAYSDKEAMKFRGNPPLVNREEARQMIRKAIADYTLGRSTRWGIESLEQQNLIGTFLWTIEKGEHQIGYSIHKDWWRKGVATEVLKAMNNYLLSQESINRLTANVHPDNIGSIRLLEKCGFKLVSHTPEILTYHKL